MLQWEDGTVDYFLTYRKTEPNPVCGSQSVVRDIEMHGCSLYGIKHVLCEEEGTSQETYASQKSLSRKSGDQLPELINSSVPLAHVFCPSGHWTHEFLACDGQSDCWQNGNVSHSNRNVTSQCQSLLSTMFTCKMGVYNVPYSLVCDHSPDCLDASDEDFCSHPSCSSYAQFECTNKQVRHYLIIKMAHIIT